VVGKGRRSGEGRGSGGREGEEKKKARGREGWREIVSVYGKKKVSTLAVPNFNFIYFS
jgi:hypothetical protein